MCGICGAEIEDLGHFILRCSKLEDERDTNLIDEHKGDNEIETLGNLFFLGGEIDRVGLMTKRLWKARKYWINRLGLEEGGRGGVHQERL